MVMIGLGWGLWDGNGAAAKARPSNNVALMNPNKSTYKSFFHTPSNVKLFYKLHV